METSDDKSESKTEKTEVQGMLSHIVDQLRKREKDVGKIFSNRNLLAQHVNDEIDKMSLLHFAVICNNLPAVKFLVEHGADLDIQIGGRTPLHFAQSYEVAEYLIRKGANKEAKDSLGWTPLLAAFYLDNFDVMHCLLKNNADQSKLRNYLREHSDCKIEELVKIAKFQRAKFHGKNMALYDC